MSGGPEAIPSNPTTSTSDLRYSLIANVGTPSERTILCRRAATLIGSRSGCKIVLRHVRVAPVHVAIINDGHRLFALDLVTHIGTRLNGLKLGCEPLTDGDLLSVHTWEFRVQLHTSDNGAAPADPVLLDPAGGGIALEHKTSGQLLKPQREHCLIGRRHGCDIVLSDNKVSRVHAVLFQFHGQPAVFDLLSRNQTFVNESSIEFQVLKDGDVLQMGDSTFVVHFSEEPVLLSPIGNNGNEENSDHSDSTASGGSGSDLIDIHATESSQRWKIAEKLEKATRKA